MRKILLIAALTLSALNGFSAEPTDSHRAAALELLLARGMPEMLESQCRLMVDKQIAMQPELAAMREKLLEFYRGAFGFEALKDDLVAIYVGEFSEAELREITRMCNTPVGKKAAAVNAKLIPVLAELFERKVREKVSTINK